MERPILRDAHLFRLVGVRAAAFGSFSFDELLEVPDEPVEDRLIPTLEGKFRDEGHAGYYSLLVAPTVKAHLHGLGNVSTRTRELHLVTGKPERITVSTRYSLRYPLKGRHIYFG
ncbi:hypothetical protein BM92_01810 [Haloferax mediterranei ATCC 33500]|uniref:Uncharacterized protein n=1 Tax=Haloferax mediterranei (strain ATCC 33500 / DSM 1411 / JCM 8866 / NBRC 14739 / NCIMB 2177 / R-4) TaxID=523841 RepID=A0A059TNB2_HALMT|nr:hypothetical protein BM92_01810 [Haloferax mediterranei ATCC 33500]